MIDSIVVPPSIHFAMGAVVVAMTLGSMVLAGWMSWRGKSLNRPAHLFLIATQIGLMIQALIGIKLLDQGLGPLQLFIHYVGGLAPLLFFFVFYWVAGNISPRPRVLLAVTSLAFLFAIMTFTIGSAYVAGTV